MVRPGVTGYVCENTADLVKRTQHLKQSRAELDSMRAAARKQAESTSWDNVFAAVYRAYNLALQPADSVPASSSVELDAGAIVKSKSRQECQNLKV